MRSSSSSSATATRKQPPATADDPRMALTTTSVKIVLLGDAGVGKSAIAIRFTQNDYNHLYNISTIGAAYMTRTMDVPVMRPAPTSAWFRERPRNKGEEKDEAKQHLKDDDTTSAKENESPAQPAVAEDALNTTAKEKDSAISDDTASDDKSISSSNPQDDNLLQSKRDKADFTSPTSAAIQAAMEHHQSFSSSLMTPASFLYDDDDDDDQEGSDEERKERRRRRKEFRRVQFKCWDTAGQEKYASLAPMYYRGAGAAILAFDVMDRRSFDVSLKRWVNELQANGPEGLILVLCGNKVDLVDDSTDDKKNQKKLLRAITYEEAELYAASVKAAFYTEVSAKEGYNVEEMFVGLANHVMALHAKNQSYLMMINDDDRDAELKSDGTRRAEDGGSLSGRRLGFSTDRSFRLDGKQRSRYSPSERGTCCGGGR